MMEWKVGKQTPLCKRQHRWPSISRMSESVIFLFVAKLGGEREGYLLVFIRSTRAQPAIQSTPYGNRYRPVPLRR